MIDEGTAGEKYVETSDTTYAYLKHFHDFLYRHFKVKKCYDEMRPVSNQQPNSLLPLRHINASR